MDEGQKEVLQELFKILSDHPEIADRITITIRPTKLLQDTKSKDKDKS